MSRSCDLVLSNFKATLEVITPTDQTPQCKFVMLPSTVSADQSAGTTRGFRILWEGSATPDDKNAVEDLDERMANHSFTVRVAYSTDWEEHQLQTIMMRDRHDLVRALRDSRNFNGVDGDSSITTGLWGRSLVRDDVERGETTWTLRQTWRCIIGEVE